MERLYREVYEEYLDALPLLRSIRASEELVKSILSPRLAVKSHVIATSAESLKDLLDFSAFLIHKVLAEYLRTEKLYVPYEAVIGERRSV